MIGKYFCSLLLLMSTSVLAECTDNCRQPSTNIRIFSGGYCGVGASFGIQKTNAHVNDEFKDRSHSMSSAFYGGTFNIGYQRQVCCNCLVGIEAGIDFGSSSSTKIGGIFKTNSYYVQNEYTKREILRQMLQETATSFETGLGAAGVGTHNNVVSAGVWNNFVNVLRFIGGANTNIRNGFTTNPADANPLFSHHGYNANNNANLQNIIGNAYTRISAYGGGDIFRGLQDLSDFVTRRYPVCATILRNFAQQDLHDLMDMPIAGTAAGGGSNISDTLLYLLNDFFSGRLLIVDSIADIGVGIGDADRGIFNALVAEINSIFNPSHMDDASLSLPLNVDMGVVRRNVKTKASFGACPYVAVKIGYYFKEIDGCMFAKIGVIHLNGHVTPVNNVYGLQEEKFHKVAPFVAAELMKSINMHWGYAVEVSHAFKTNKRLNDVNLFGVRIENKTSISRTNIRLMATYRF